MRPGHFESFGVRVLYLAVAKLVHERPIAASTSASTDADRAELRRVKEGTHYFLSANLARAACYAPHAVCFLLSRSVPGLTCVAVLFVCHGALVLVEAYKRSLCEHWLPLAAEPTEPAVVAERAQPSAWFRPRPIENVKLYKALGLELFRIFVTWVMSTLRHGFSGQKMEFIANPSRASAVEFEAGTRVSECVHWVSAASVAPLVVVSWWQGPVQLALWSTVILWGDFYLALLQRYHRVRVWPVVSRVLERRA